MHTFSFFFFSLNLFCYFFVLSFCFFLLLIFQADTSSFLFHLIVENLILHILLIIMIIIPCSGIFRNVFFFPGLIDGPQLVEHRTGIAKVMGSNPVEALIFFSGFFFPIA